MDKFGHKATSTNSLPRCPCRSSEDGINCDSIESGPDTSVSHEESKNESNHDEDHQGEEKNYEVMVNVVHLDTSRDFFPTKFPKISEFP